MQAKFTGEGTSVSMEFAETKSGISTEKIGPPKPVGAKYNARDGKLAAPFWTANKGTELHWHQGVLAHLKIDHQSEITEAEYDAALDAVKNLKIG